LSDTALKLTASSTADKLPLEKFHRLLDLVFWGKFSKFAEGVTTELGGRADNGLRPYPSLIKVAFMGGQIG
jgi:hypothetical protein